MRQSQADYNLLEETNASLICRIRTFAAEHAAAALVSAGAVGELCWHKIDWEYCDGKLGIHSPSWQNGIELHLG